MQIMTAIGERDAAVEKAEREAGQAIRAMTTSEGLTMREVTEWCGDCVSLGDVRRLSKGRAAPKSPDLEMDASR